MKSYENQTNLFEFGPKNKVFIKIKDSQLIAGTNFFSTIETFPIIKLNLWYHLAFVLENETGYIYIDSI